MSKKSKKSKKNQKNARTFNRRSAWLGLAFGDAYGQPVEFLKDLEAIDVELAIAKNERPLFITDDTQMSLLLDIAVAPLTGNLATPELAAQTITAAWLAWMDDDESFLPGRAPGTSCIRAADNYVQGAIPGTGGVVSTGCGAVMRVLPVVTLPTYREMAALQAATTHREGSAIVSAVVLAEAMRAPAGSHLDRALDVLPGISDDPEILKWITRGAMCTADEAKDTLAQGVEAVSEIVQIAWQIRDIVLETAYNVAEISEDGNLYAHTAEALASCTNDDPVFLLGGGWSSSSAISSALLIADLFPGDLPGAIHRAARTVGDSDSVAAITGATVGGELSWQQATNQLQATFADFEEQYIPRLEASANNRNAR